MKMQTTHTLMTEVHYVNCKEDGPWRTWYRYRDYALESERYFVDGRLDGVWRHWYDNERHSLAYEHHYNNGSKVGMTMINIHLSMKTLMLTVQDMATGLMQW